jgi:hypothetical protein
MSIVQIKIIHVIKFVINYYLVEIIGVNKRVMMVHVKNVNYYLNSKKLVFVEELKLTYF